MAGTARPARRPCPSFVFPARPVSASIKDLGPSWKDLADYFEVETFVKARWQQGDEPSELWEYLRIRRRLGELPSALAEVGRRDLVPLLEIEAVPPARPRRRIVVLAVAAAVLVVVAGGLVAWKWPRDETAPGYVKLQTLPAPATVFFETDSPVCATFGTASDVMKAAPGLRLPTPHWR
jgi:hypothetical protein